MPLPIHHTFAPLGNARQVKMALRLLFRAREGVRLADDNREGVRLADRDLLRNELSKRWNGDTFLFSSGREALLAFLQAMNLQPDDEILVQAYTCAVVPNAIQAAGLRPVYADVDRETLNMDPKDAEKKITAKTKALICQHTFGIPAPVEELRALCDAKYILFIEDCAHVLPDREGPEDVGRLGDVILMSFGRDKAVSGITGGGILVRESTSNSATSNRQHICSTLRTLEQLAKELPAGTINRLLLYPILYALARPIYSLGLGKALLVLARRLGLLIPIVTAREKRGHQENTQHQLPEACATLILDQFRQLSDFNVHRRCLTQLYLEACAEHGWSVLHGIRSDLPLQKFPLFFPQAENLRKQLKKKNIHLWDGWTGCVVCPRDVTMDEMRYRSGEDPAAEKVCEEILSLPTHPGTTEADAKKAVKELAKLT